MTNKYLDKIAGFSLSGAKKTIGILKGTNVSSARKFSEKAKQYGDKATIRRKDRHEEFMSTTTSKDSLEKRHNLLRRADTSSKAEDKIFEIHRKSVANVKSQRELTQAYRGHAGSLGGYAVGAGIGAHSAGPEHRLAGAAIGGLAGGAVGRGIGKNLK